VTAQRLQAATATHSKPQPQSIPRKVGKLGRFITPITVVYGTQITIVNEVYKPTNITEYSLENGTRFDELHLIRVAWRDFTSHCSSAQRSLLADHLARPFDKVGPKGTGKCQGNFMKFHRIGEEFHGNFVGIHRNFMRFLEIS
jgi:hypothetical protein